MAHICLSSANMGLESARNRDGEVSAEKRGAAANALRLFGPEAKAALPTLIKALRETIAGEELEPKAPLWSSALVATGRFRLSKL